MKAETPKDNSSTSRQVSQLWAADWRGKPLRRVPGKFPAQGLLNKIFGGGTAQRSYFQMRRKLSKCIRIVGDRRNGRVKLSY